MTHPLDIHCKTPKHLRRVQSVPVEAGGDFILHEGYVYMGSRYGSNNTLCVIDVRDPKAARLAATMRFKRAIGSLAVRGKTLYASEWQRAINLIDIGTPADPNYFDCALALGKSVYEFGFIGDFLVAGLHWDGVGIMDVSAPNKAQWVDVVKLDEGYVEHLAVVGDRIFAAGGNGGIRVFEIQERKLVQVACPGDVGFRAERIFTVGDRVWVTGTPEDKEAHILVIAPSKPGAIESTMELEVSMPNTLVAIGDGVVAGWNGYRCAGYAPSQGWARALFSQFEDDENKSYVEVPADRKVLGEAEAEALEMLSTSCIDDTSCVVRSGDYLLAAQGNALNVYALEEGSALTRR